MMHIVQMINALRVGGAEKLVATFSEAVQEKDIRVTVLTLRQNVPEVQMQVEATGAAVVPFNHRKILAPRRFRDLVRFLRSTKPDILHTHLTMATILGSASGTLTGIPVVTSLHNTTMRTQAKLLLSSLETFMLRYRVSYLLAVGWQTAEAQQSRLGNRTIEVVPNAVPVPEAVPPPRRLEIRSGLKVNPDQVILLSVGRIEPQKGVLDLIASFSLVQQQHPNTRLVIAGSGSLSDQLVERIKTLGLIDSVRLLGLRQDIPDLLAACDLFVSAAHWEGLPVASLEAMAAGKTLAVTAVGDLPRVVIPGTGLLSPPHKPDALAANIAKLVEDPELRKTMGTAAREHIQENYNASVWADRLLAIYNQVIQAEIAPASLWRRQT